MYVDSIFQDFESFLRSEIDLVGEDIRLVLDEYNSNFSTYEIQPGIYTFKEISEALLKILQSEYDLFNISVDMEFDDLTRKTKLAARPGIRALRLDEKLFLVLSLVLLHIGIVITIMNTIVRKLYTQV